MAYDDKFVSAPFNVDLLEHDLLRFDYSSPAFIEFQKILNDMIHRGELDFINDPTSTYDSSYIPPPDFYYTDSTLFSPLEGTMQPYNGTTTFHTYSQPAMLSPTMPKPEAQITFIQQLPVTNTIARVANPYPDNSAATTPEIPEDASSTGSSAYYCICGTSLGNSLHVILEGELRQHLKLHPHNCDITRQCPWPADQCDKAGRRFSDFSTLVRHVKIHFGTSLDCEYCGRSARDKFTLNRHLQVCKRNTGRGPRVRE